MSPSCSSGPPRGCPKPETHVIRYCDRDAPFLFGRRSSPSVYPLKKMMRMKLQPDEQHHGLGIEPIECQKRK